MLFEEHQEEQKSQGFSALGRAFQLGAPNPHTPLRWQVAPNWDTNLKVESGKQKKNKGKHHKRPKLIEALCC